MTAQSSPLFPKNWQRNLWYIDASIFSLLAQDNWRQKGLRKKCQRNTFFLLLSLSITPFHRPKITATHRLTPWFSVGLWRQPLVNWLAAISDFVDRSLGNSFSFLSRSQDVASQHKKISFYWAPIIVNQSIKWPIKVAARDSSFLSCQGNWHEGTCHI